MSQCLILFVTLLNLNFEFLLWSLLLCYTISSSRKDNIRVKACVIEVLIRSVAMF